MPVAQPATVEHTNGGRRTLTSIARSFADWHEHARRNQARIEALRERDDLSPAPGARKTPLRRFRPALFAFARSPTRDSVGRADGDAHGPAQVRAGITTGSQAAVVKLASFAGGRARIGALLNYQSREGQLELEREDGSLVQGVEAIRQLAADWDDEPGRRKPSKDVLYFTASVGSSVSGEAVKAALAEALEGHNMPGASRARTAARRFTSWLPPPAPPGTREARSSVSSTPTSR